VQLHIRSLLYGSCEGWNTARRIKDDCRSTFVRVVKHLVLRRISEGKSIHRDDEGKGCPRDIEMEFDNIDCHSRHM
jgi:hypothetical protein